MIRLPQSLRSSMVTTGLASTRSRLWTYEQQGITGLAASRPSEAPDLWARAEQVRAASAEQTLYGNNAEHAANLLNVADDALGAATNTIKRGWEIAVAMSSEVPDQGSRDAAAGEIDALRTTLIERANTRYAGRYLFSGQSYDAPAFDAAAVYLGSTEAPATRIGEDAWIQIGFDGQAIFQGGVDLPQMLADLAAAIRSGDHTQVTPYLDQLDAGVTQLAQARQEIGSLQVRAGDAIATSDSLHVLLEEQLDNLVGVDEVEVYTKISELRTTYEASLAIAAKSLTGSLFDYVR